MVYMINYDLIDGKDYTKLIKAIEAYNDYAHALKSGWYISTNAPLGDVFKNLSQQIDGDDKLIVCMVVRGCTSWTSNTIDAKVHQWLEVHL